MRVRKIFVIQLILVIIVSTILNIVVPKKVYAYTQYNKTGINEFPEVYQNYLKQLLDLHPNWNFSAFYTGISWDEFMRNESSLGGAYPHGRNMVVNSSDISWKDSCGIVKSGYTCASPDIIAYYADPRNFLTESGMFQFLEMSYNSSIHNKAGVEGVIKGSFMDTSLTFNINGQERMMKYSEIIMEAAKESGISPYSIAIKIIQEVGRQGSNSVSGTYPGYEGYYNFYNIGSYDTGNAIENGLMYAKEKEWDNQYKSIVEGAKYLADSYIKVGQNTAYFYKFDVIDGTNGVYWHQYMTNIQDPSSQARNLYNTYANNGLLDIPLHFIIPVYNDMPSVCRLPSSINASDPTSYYVNGTGVALRSSPTVNSTSVATLSKNEIITVIKLSVTDADGYSWAQIKRANGTEGYVANRYLIQCVIEKPIISSSIARIDDTYILTIPNTKLTDLAREISIDSYEVKDINGTIIAAEQNASTTFVLNNLQDSKSYKIVVLGDINGDGTVNSGDLLILKKHLLGKSILIDDSKMLAADANIDKTINSGDLLSIKKYLLGIKNIIL